MDVWGKGWEGLKDRGRAFSCCSLSGSTTAHVCTSYIATDYTYILGVSLNNNVSHKMYPFLFLQRSYSFLQTGEIKDTGIFSEVMIILTLPIW